MGAGEWSVTIHNENGDIPFDLRAMDRKQRGQFHGRFMASTRKYLYARKGN